MLLNNFRFKSVFIRHISSKWDLLISPIVEQFLLMISAVRLLSVSRAISPKCIPGYMVRTYYQRPYSSRTLQRHSPLAMM